MKTTKFKMIGQKAPNGKIVLIAVVDDDFFEKITPNVFELQCTKEPKTIYTGTNTTIKLDNNNLKNRNELSGSGIAGILTEEQWHCKTQTKKDLLGISLN